jgi:hypothetical protein
MKTYSRLTALALVVLCCAVGSAGAQQGEQRLIQIAVLLDTSNSMDGLIGQAKTQLWNIVNEMGHARRGNIPPRLEVALYEYGNDMIPAGENHIRLVSPFTRDLDRISEELFALKTNGGSEYCGAVIGSSIKGLQWSGNRTDLRVIIIAGNEPFTQGEIDFRKTCKDASARGIVVNSIYCGSLQEGIDTGWKDGALMTNGKYMNIDQSEQVEYIKAPQDEEITRLGQELNKTYIAYGKAGNEKKVRQEKQDENAAVMSKEAVVQRSVAKASRNYDNTQWDLVDAAKNDGKKVEEMKTDELPDEMKKMTPAQRKQYVDTMAQKRSTIQKKIGQLNAERSVYVEKEMKKKAGDNTLGKAIIDAMRNQAKEKGYTFEK